MKRYFLSVFRSLIVFLSVLLAVQAGPNEAAARGLSFSSMTTNQIRNVVLSDDGVTFKSGVTFAGSGYEFDVSSYLSNYGSEAYVDRAEAIYKDRTKGEDDPIAALRELTTKGSWKKTADAFAAFGYLGEGAKSEIPVILPFLQHKRPQVRLNAVWALARIAPEDPVVRDALVRFLKTNFTDSPSLIMWALAQTGEPTEEMVDAVVEITIKNANTIMLTSLEILKKSDYVPYPIFEKYLQHFDTTYRRNAVLLSAGWPGIDRTPLVPYYIPLVNDADKDVRLVSVHVLGLIGEPAHEAGPAIQKVFETEDGDIKETAFWALNKIKAFSPEDGFDNVDIPSLLTSENANLRASGLQAVNELPLEERPQYLQNVLPLITDDSYLVQKSALAVVGNMGPAAAEAVPALVAVFEDECNATMLALKNNILTAIANIKDPEGASLPLLIGIIEKGEPEFMRQALSAVYAMEDAGRPAAPAVLGYLKQWQPGGEGVRTDMPSAEIVIALMAYGKAGDLEGEGLEVVMSYLNQNNMTVQLGVAYVLTQNAGKPQVLEGLVSMIRDSKNYLARVLALSTLQQMGAKAQPALPELREIYEATDESPMKKSLKEAIEKIDSAIPEN